MKKFLFIVIAFAALFSMAACSDSETYADQRNRERDSINAFLRNENYGDKREAVQGALGS